MRLLLAALVFQLSFSAHAQTNWNVLVLYSNNRLLPANIAIDGGMRGALAKSPDRPVELFAEFLDLPAFSGPAYENTVVAYLHDKYATRPPQAIVVAGQLALEFLLRHRPRLFADVPVVHVAVDKAFLDANAPMPPDVVGVPVVYDYAGTVRQALRWRPATRRVVVVTGASFRDREWENDTRAALASLTGLPEVLYLPGLPADALAKRLGELGAGDIVFTPGFFRDGNDRAFSPRESIVLMASSSKAPIFGPYETFIGAGVVGGSMPAYAEIGRQGALAIERLRAGASLTALALPTGIPFVVQVDWRQARRWGIGVDDLPPDAVVHFREPTFWEANRDIALAVAAVILVQATLIGALLLERRRRRRFASALEESERRMNLAARAAHLSMWNWDLAGGGVWTTTKLREAAGLAPQPPVDFADVLRKVHPVDRPGFERTVRRAAETGEELYFEYRSPPEAGPVRWFSVRGSAIQGKSGTVTGVIQEITERKTAQLQAEKDRAALTHMTRVSMMGQLSASIAHQLNQPLAAILGNAEAARQMLDRDGLDIDELKEICDDIITEDNRAAEVIRRLGALYLRGEVILAPIDLNALVSETLELVRTELTTRQVEAVLELSADLPPVDGGRIQLQQVILNLILNAADAMAAFEPAKRLVTLTTEQVGESVRLCVSDRGAGIAPEHFDHLFDSFWSTKAGGMGIGLAICRSIIEAHRGTLSAANRPGGGATFCATWPMRQPG